MLRGRFTKKIYIGHDNFFISCLMYKLIMRLNKIYDKGLNDNKKLCLSLNHETTFVPNTDFQYHF